MQTCTENKANYERYIRPAEETEAAIGNRKAFKMDPSLKKWKRHGESMNAILARTLEKAGYDSSPCLK